jgi:hypothetical protein
VHPEELLAALRRKPFVPFRLHVTDGTSYVIRHPEMVLVTRRSAYVAILPSGDPAQLPDRATAVAFLHISQLEELPTAASA